MKSKPAAPVIQSAFAVHFAKKEARAELMSCALFAGVLLLLVIVLFLTGQATKVKALPALMASLGCFLAVSGLIAWIVKRGSWHPSISYLNTALQVTLVSVVLAIVVSGRGAAFALSTALPMVYCLVVSITAFRLKPWLSFFAGTLAAIEWALVYALIMRPLISVEDLVATPTLGWAAMGARIMVLAAVGVSCALAAGSLRRQVREQAEDQSRIELLERTFGRLVAPEVAKQILENEDWMQPARRDAVVMFADLQGFTNYSENRTPEEVAEFLNSCWSVAADIVEAHGGVINKYLGDGFLAIFGVPLALDDAESAAAQTASQLQEALSAQLEAQGLALCIGIHAGPMIVGGIGSESRCEFTVIGSTVNLASRIEGLNRPLKTQCLTSQQVADKISERWDLKDHGTHQVKGVAEGVGVYELGEKRP